VCPAIAVWSCAPRLFGQATTPPVAGLNKYPRGGSSPTGAPMSRRSTIQRGEGCGHVPGRWPRISVGVGLRTWWLRLRLHVRPMAVDDLPFPVNPTVDFCRIPASQHAFRSIRQFSIIDKVERQERDIDLA